MAGLGNIFHIFAKKGTKNDAESKKLESKIANTARPDDQSLVSEIEIFLNNVIAYSNKVAAGGKPEQVVHYAQGYSFRLLDSFPNHHTKWWIQITPSGRAGDPEPLYRALKNTEQGSYGDHSCRLFVDVHSALGQINSADSVYVPGSPKSRLWYLSTKGCEPFEGPECVLRIELGLANWTWLEWDEVVSVVLQDPQLKNLIGLAMMLRDKIRKSAIPCFNPFKFGIKYPDKRLPGQERFLAPEGNL